MLWLALFFGRFSRLEAPQRLVIKKRSDRGQANLPMINERIRFPKIRAIDADGTQLGIMHPRDALRIAEERNLDLVVVSEDAQPPVCRIMDYGKYKFEQEKRAKEARKKQHTADVKEVKMRYTIGEHDYQVRLRDTIRFLKDGDKVKATIMFRGREIQHANLAKDLLMQLAADSAEIGEVQQEPSVEGRNMIMILSPKRT
ncbi:MAG: translation initiation factor IF-3 [Aphanocapsa lilacina HA4352-LM1]|uniref:Translation initiation factor IF-3 n=2 Tax=Gloeobacter TaxID=33071 RepID=IF3_GLOVI|nr:RecName: Full=Translation initiation factor IF-3 [Gloeobacter violaceus PCC 7421]MBW4698652.1 translation initiation factor IF-3 [Aphanocapsa lilacina HA4352-LM1]UFP96188.1 translation initiation factor IF-3 [Gloeobacter morelensis MG652769]BAC89697.1 translation initiation factor IF-3 [Gloeobacter violaceus PCC 7421]